LQINPYTYSTLSNIEARRHLKRIENIESGTRPIMTLTSNEKQPELYGKDPYDLTRFVSFPLASGIWDTKGKLCNNAV
jgi:hypothetical protein